MAKRIIMGINVPSFAEASGSVQKVLSEYGCSIRTRLGLHEAADGVCAPNGLILLEFISGSAKADELTAKLQALNGITVQRMEF